MQRQFETQKKLRTNLQRSYEREAKDQAGLTEPPNLRRRRLPLLLQHCCCRCRMGGLSSPVAPNRHRRLHRTFPAPSSASLSLPLCQVVTLGIRFSSLRCDFDLVVVLVGLTFGPRPMKTLLLLRPKQFCVWLFFLSEGFFRPKTSYTLQTQQKKCFSLK